MKGRIKYNERCQQIEMYEFIITILVLDLYIENNKNTDQFILFIVSTNGEKEANPTNQWAFNVDWNSKSKLDA